jgi:hypothetical protein
MLLSWPLNVAFVPVGLSVLEIACLSVFTRTLLSGLPKSCLQTWACCNFRSPHCALISFCNVYKWILVTYGMSHAIALGAVTILANASRLCIGSTHGSIISMHTHVP